MSNYDYREINNALNNYYGNKMNLYVEGSKYREEYRQKMKEQKKLVEEFQAKADAFDEVLKSYDESLSEGHMADDVCNIVEKYKKQKEESEWH